MPEITFTFKLHEPFYFIYLYLFFFKPHTGFCLSKPKVLTDIAGHWERLPVKRQVSAKGSWGCPGTSTEVLR
jgi:hypothetical protein